MRTSITFGLLVSCTLLLAACSSAPVVSQKPAVSRPPVTAGPSTTPSTAPTNPITQLPPQTEPVPKNPADMPAFGSDAFNRIKDAYPDNPPDLSQLQDMVPREEPLAKYGNKSPYTVLGKTYRVLPSAKGFKQTGKASFYGKKFHGLRTSSGEPYDMYAMTAAHRNLPLPSYVRVTNTTNGKSVIVKVNDRGPFHSERVMDLSYAAAAKLDILKAGTGQVRIEALDPADFAQQAASTPAPPAQMAVEAPHFFVQVGAFGARGNASALQSRLAELIYSPINIVSSEGIHRVHVGPFFNREDAEKAATLIKNHDLGTPLVVNR